MRASRSQHLVFLAHVWVCAPFLFAWTYLPPLRHESRAAVIGPLAACAVIAGLYLLARTWLAWRDPPWLRWEYVFPFVDVLLISVVVHFRRDPDSVLTYLYLFPVAEAVGTLRMRWSVLIGCLSILGAVAATWGQHGMHSPLAFWFRLIILAILASLLTWLARHTSELRAQLHIATDRNRIAMEMHDGVQAQLIAIASQLELARCVALQDGGRAAQIASDCRDLARRAADELRFLVHRLRASRPAEAFVPALKQYVHNLSTRCGVAMTVVVSGESYVLDPEREHALFRIVQESLNNTLKHAGADSVAITLEYGADALTCAVQDDGRGFDPAAPQDAEGLHIGLTGMRERAQQAGGTLELVSAPGAGTTVTARLPRSFVPSPSPGDSL